MESKSISKSEWFYLPQQLPLPLKYNALGIARYQCAPTQQHRKLVCGLESSFARRIPETKSAKKKSLRHSSFQEKKTSISSSVSFDEETLHPEFLDSKLNEFQFESANKATHLVEQVVYGAEFICSMQSIGMPKEGSINIRRRILPVNSGTNQNSS